MEKNKENNLLYILKSFGPSFILTATYIGAGSVVTSSTAGALFGYKLLWWIAILSAINGIWQYSINKFTIQTGKPMMTAIRERYPKLLAVIGGILGLITIVVFGIGNFMASGMALNIIFPGLAIKTGGIIATIFCILVIILKGFYKKIEKGMMACIALMVVFFIVVYIIIGGSPAGETVSGLVPSMPAGSQAVMLSLLGTTVSFGPMIYGSTFVREKGWQEKDIEKKGLLADALAGPIAYFIIIGIILCVGAALFAGNPPTSGLAIANGLVEALNGSAAIRVIFGIAFLGATISSLIGAPTWGVGIFYQGIGKESSMDTWVPKIIMIAAMVFASIMGLTVGGIPTQILMIAQWSGIITTPLLGVLAIMALRDKKLRESRKLTSIPTWIILILLWALLMYVAINNLIGLIG
ncbi:MAG: Nramp family divalent metal transporter [Parasporobacterium sp.]|nr:Nramp family divalent metal transporter [Parasporobacterium sp.]